MNYNKFILPEVPHSVIKVQIFGPSLEGYVYVGKGSGTKNKSLANSWNGGKPFAAIWYNDTTGWSNSQTLGEDMHSHYFVKEDAPILSVMYPADDKWLEREYYRLLEKVKELEAEIERLNDNDTRDRDYW
jgi:hypothetical protein